MGVGVSLDGQRGKPSPLDALTELVADDLQTVNALIIQRMESPVALIPQLAGHIVVAGVVARIIERALTDARASLCSPRGSSSCPNPPDGGSRE